MNIRWKIVAVGFGLSVAAALAFAAASRPHPSDEALQARFLYHRVDFERLVAMANEDNRLSRIAPDFTWLNDDVAWPRRDVGISEERWDDYRQEFRRIGTSVGILKYSNPTLIFFPITSIGLVPSGSEKGLVYSQAPLTPVLKSLDKRPPAELWDGPDRSRLLVYKPIEDHWYIYFRKW